MSKKNPGWRYLPVAEMEKIVVGQPIAEVLVGAALEAICHSGPLGREPTNHHNEWPDIAWRLADGRIVAMWAAKIWCDTCGPEDAQYAITEDGHD